ncbi:MAG: cupredoxin domain-containing protein [Chloroflexi bacterium]|nr:cupredoxin domain-containing protein [Chloroflexota bacterium]
MGVATGLIAFTLGVALAACVCVVRQRRIRAQLTDQGFQQFEIVVKGRYIPDVVKVRRGIPLRLYFKREEDTPCSEHVIFSECNIAARLPGYQRTMVSFTPAKCGEILFTCAFGHYQGRLIVVEPTRRDLARVLAGQEQIIGGGGRGVLVGGKGEGL